MEQLLLPLLEGAEMLTLTLEFRKQGTIVYYLHSSKLIYSQEEYDLNISRCITSNFLLQGLCKNSDISRTMHVSADIVRRYKKHLAPMERKHFSENYVREKA